MELNVASVIVGNGKHVSTPEGKLRYDELGRPVMKYTIYAYEIEDLDGEIETKIVAREDAGAYAFSLLNKDILSELKTKRDALEPLFVSDCRSRIQYDLKNATVCIRTTIKKDNKAVPTFYLKARLGVIRSLEVPELVVSINDSNGNTKSEYLFLLKKNKKVLAGPTLKKKSKTVSKDQLADNVNQFKTALDSWQPNNM